MSEMWHLAVRARRFLFEEACERDWGVFPSKWLQTLERSKRFLRVVKAYLPDRNMGTDAPDSPRVFALQSMTLRMADVDVYIHNVRKLVEESVKFLEYESIMCLCMFFPDMSFNTTEMMHSVSKSKDGTLIKMVQRTGIQNFVPLGEGLYDKFFPKREEVTPFRPMHLSPEFLNTKLFKSNPSYRGEQSPREFMERSAEVCCTCT